MVTGLQTDVVRSVWCDFLIGQVSYTYNPPILFFERIRQGPVIDIRDLRLVTVTITYPWPTSRNRDHQVSVAYVS